mmetsp:Transcript_23582/g.49903  ORF Transcript_23582/g.49903 Transcript_23582/m.49903 type:complete len:80 (+) Transcript_23582:1943-2182(+)
MDDGSNNQSLHHPARNNPGHVQNASSDNIQGYQSTHHHCHNLLDMISKDRYQAESHYSQLPAEALNMARLMALKKADPP